MSHLNQLLVTGTCWKRVYRCQAELGLCHVIKVSEMGTAAERSSQSGRTTWFHLERCEGSKTGLQRGALRDTKGSPKISLPCKHDTSKWLNHVSMQCCCSYVHPKILERPDG